MRILRRGCRWPEPGVRPRRGSSAGGFTLLEVLLASIMTTAVVAVVYEMYVGSLRAARRGTAETASYQAARAVLQTVADDVRSAVMSGGVFGFGLRGTDGGEDELASDALEVSAVAPVRWREEPEGIAAEPLTPFADFRHISYRVVTAEEATTEAESGTTTPTGVAPAAGLVREVRTLLTSSDAAVSEVQVLSRQVLVFNVQYYDGLAWVDDWDAGASGQLPVAVRLTVVVVPDEASLVPVEEAALSGEMAEMYPNARTFTTVVDLPMAVAPSDLQIVP